MAKIFQLKIVLGVECVYSEEQVSFDTVGFFFLNTDIHKPAYTHTHTHTHTSYFSLAHPEERVWLDGPSPCRPRVMMCSMEISDLKNVRSLVFIIFNGVVLCS